MARVVERPELILLISTGNVERWGEIQKSHFQEAIFGQTTPLSPQQTVRRVMTSWIGPLKTDDFS